MGRVGLALKLFFKTLGNAAFAERARRLTETGAEAPEAAHAAARPAVSPVARPPLRSEALTLLAVLQREGRLVDFLKEPIASYSDAQIGAAVRDVHRDCAGALERVFAIRPVVEKPEGSAMEVPAGFDAGRIRLTGNVAGSGPFDGTLRHSGWEASCVQLPEWSGQDTSARIVAAAEVEIK